jgi:DNA-directed RNA polymerase subunit RPC12/RpoP
MAFVGNIGVADIFNCSNCGAVFYRNIDEQAKNCRECNSRFVYPLHLDVKTQKTFWKCGNPGHGIRLKIWDLIMHNNSLLNEQMKEIKERDRLLQLDYIKKMQEIQAQASRWRGKGKLEDQINNLNVWALEERRKLYGVFSSKGLRCSVYKMEKQADKTVFIHTNDGCGALSQLNMRKIMDTDVKGTVIDRNLPKQQASPNITITPELLSNAEINQPQIIPDSKMDSSENRSPESTNQQLIKTQIIRAEELPTYPIEFLQETDAIFDSLPKLKENQIYIKIALYGKTKGMHEFRVVNYGVIPVEISKSTNKINLGKQDLMAAYWKNQDFFKNYPGIFNSIPTRTNNNSLMNIFHELGGLMIEKGNNSFIPLYKVSRSMQSEKLSDFYKNNSKELEEISERIRIDDITGIAIKAFYAKDQEIKTMLHDLIFRFYIDGGTQIKA